RATVLHLGEAGPDGVAPLDGVRHGQAVPVRHVMPDIVEVEVRHPAFPPGELEEAREVRREVDVVLAEQQVSADRQRVPYRLSGHEGVASPARRLGLVAGAEEDLWGEARRLELRQRHRAGFLALLAADDRRRERPHATACRSEW